MTSPKQSPKSKIESNIETFAHALEQPKNKKDAKWFAGVIYGLNLALSIINRK